LLPMGDVAETVNDCASRLPAPALRPFIERYLGYRLEGFPAGFHKGVPSSRMPFMFSFDRPVTTSGGPDGGAGGSYWAFAGGLHTRAAHIEHDGNQHGVAVQLTPLGTRTVLGLP